MTSPCSQPVFPFRFHGWRAVLCGLAWLVGAGLGHATDVPLTPVDELARRADVVVRGRVVSLEATRDAEKRPFTRIEFDVLAVWKGPATNRLAVVQASSPLGPRPVQVPGEPQFRLGEDVVVFAVRNPRGELVTLDLARGKFSVRTNAVSGAVEAANDGARSAAGYGLPGRVPVPLERLTQQVKDTLK